jgi:non-ribosomal peptide synthetase component F
MLNPTGDKGWRSACRDLAIDHGGPTEVLFDHFDDDGIEAPIIDLFDQVVARHGDKLATVDEATKLTYRELQQASRHLARRIERLVPPGRPVGILLPNNALFPVAALEPGGLMCRLIQAIPWRASRRFGRKPACRR